MARTLKHFVMSPWFDNILRRRSVLLCGVLILGSPCVQSQDALSCLIPARFGSGQAIWTAQGQTIRLQQAPSLTFDLYHRNVDQGVPNSQFKNSRLQVNWTVPSKRGSKGTASGITGLLEDDREGQALQRFRLLVGGFKKIRIGQTSHLTGAIQLGYGLRTWRNQGLWDSQYMSNPVEPALAESGESILQNNQHYLEAGTELTFQTTAWSAAYRVLHAPVDQGFFKYSKDPYALRHSALVAWRPAIPLRNTVMQGLVWSEIERHGGAMALSTGAMVEQTFGQDSRLTDLKSATAVALGLVYRHTGQLAPIVSVRFQRRWTCWLAPDWRVGSAGISTGWSAGFRSQISL